MNRDLSLRVLILTLLLVSIPSAHAQTQGLTSPYAGMETRDIKALSEADIQGLLSGAGMGYAMAAELNGYPGPKHVLELAAELVLTNEQRERTEALFSAMQAEAIVHGKKIIALEAELDDAFASNTVDADLIQVLTAEIGAVEGKLRAAHLRTHLEMTPILSMHQRHLYQQLRGYGEGGMDHSNMDHSNVDHDH